MKLRPHMILFAPGVLLLITSIFLNDDTTDLHLYDTYYIVALREYYMALAFLLLFVGLLYWIFRRYFFSRLLCWIHVVIHLLSVLFAAALPLFETRFTDAHSYQSSNMSSRELGIVLGVWLLSQVIFLYNVGKGYLRRIKR